MGAVVVVLVVLVALVDPVFDDLVPFPGVVVVVVLVVAEVAPVDVVPSNDCAATISACMAAMSDWY